MLWGIRKLSVHNSPINHVIPIVIIHIQSKYYVSLVSLFVQPLSPLLYCSSKVSDFAVPLALSLCKVSDFAVKRDVHLKQCRLNLLVEACLFLAVARRFQEAGRSAICFAFGVRVTTRRRQRYHTKRGVLPNCQQSRLSQQERLWHVMWAYQ